MGRAKKNVEVEAQVIARGNVVPMMTETESEETVQYVSDEDAAREDNDILHYGILVLSDYRKGALCMESAL